MHRELTVKTCKLFVSDPLNISRRRTRPPGSVMESSSELLSMSSPSHEGNKMESRGAARAPEPKVDVSPAECLWHYSLCNSLNAKSLSETKGTARKLLSVNKQDSCIAHHNLNDAP